MYESRLQGDQRVQQIVAENPKQKLYSSNDMSANRSHKLSDCSRIRNRKRVVVARKILEFEQPAGRFVVPPSHESLALHLH
jgi:hypothetical protein